MEELKNLKVANIIINVKEISNYFYNQRITNFRRIRITNLTNYAGNL